MCTDLTYILWKFGEDMCYQTQMPLIFVIFFQAYIGQGFRPKKQCEDQNSGHVRLPQSLINHLHKK